MKLSTLNYTELVALKAELETELKRREQEEKAKARKQIVEIARTYGLNVEEVLGKGGAVRKPVEAKYRHPANPELTWTGRGRKPVWVQDLLAEGQSLQDITI